MKPGKNWVGNKIPLKSTKILNRPEGRLINLEYN